LILSESPPLSYNKLIQLVSFLSKYPDSTTNYYWLGYCMNDLYSAIS